MPKPARWAAPRSTYRLRQVDVEGPEPFSPVVAVAVGKLAATAQLDVYPNLAPTAQAVHLDCRNLPAGGGQLLAYSEAGQLVYQSALIDSATQQLTLPAFSAGLYISDSARQRRP